MNNKTDCRQRNPQNRLILGIFIVIIGVLSLIDNLGFFDTRQILSFWPVAFIILGVLKINQSHHHRGFFAGCALLATGTLLTLHNLGLITFHWNQWWPVFIIAAGVSYIFRGNQMISDNTVKAIDQQNELPGATSNRSDLIEITAIMSGSKSNNASANFQGGEITAIMGGVQLDLRSATLISDTNINVLVAFGSIEIMIPNDWLVVLNGTPILGGIEDKSVPPMNSQKRLIVNGTVVMGGIEIRN